MNDETKPAAKVESFEDKYAVLINAKVAAGLQRDDAILVIKHQLEADAKAAAKAKAAKK